jgi:hypothetical protein
MPIVEAAISKANYRKLSILINFFFIVSYSMINAWSLEWLRKDGGRKKIMKKGLVL